MKNPEERSPSADEVVSIQSDGLALAGSFDSVEEPQAAALILSGSGKIDRNGNAPKLRLGLNVAIAQALNANRMCSLRFDKRGAGESEGEFLSTGFQDNYRDVRSALGWLATRCPGLPIFVIGHSEGALHAAHLAANESLAGAVLLACPARVGEQVLIWQAEQIIPTLSNSSKFLLKILHIDPLKSQRKQLDRIRASSGNVIRVQGKRINAKWLREFMTYDPLPTMQSISVPVLAISAGHDLQVPPEDAQIISKTVVGPCQVTTIDEASHLFRDDPESKGPRDYRRAVRQPVSHTLIPEIIKWIGVNTSH